MSPLVTILTDWVYNQRLIKLAGISRRLELVNRECVLALGSYPGIMVQVLEEVASEEIEYFKRRFQIIYVLCFGSENSQNLSKINY